MAKPAPNTRVVTLASNHNLDQWVSRIEDLEVYSNPRFVSSLGEGSAAVSGSCGEIDPRGSDLIAAAMAKKAAEQRRNKDPMCSHRKADPVSAPDPSSFARWLRMVD